MSKRDAKDAFLRLERDALPETRRDADWSLDMASNVTVTKIDSFFSEFPFLRQYCDSKLVSEVRVRRWDDHLLDMCPELHGYERLLERNAIYLLDNSFKTVAVVGEYPGIERQWWNPLSWFKTFRAEPTHTTIKNLGERAADVTLILGIHTGAEYDGDLVVVIYKAPRGFKNLKLWFDFHTQEAARDARIQMVAET